MQINAALLLARLLLAFLFVSSGLAGLSDISGTAGYFAGLGFPMPTAVTWIVGLFELTAGSLTLLGFKTRPVALLLAVFSVAAGIIGHHGQGTDAALAFLHSQALMKDLAIAGGFLSLAVTGAGRWSVDGQRFGR